MNTEKISATLTTIAASHVGAPPADNQQDKKAGAALLAQIGVYAEEAEKVTSQSKGNGLGAEAPPSAPPSDPSDSDAGQSDSSDASRPPLPPLLALLMAGITIESQTNGLMTSLGTMSSAMTKASTDAAAALAANLKLFYDHALDSNGAMSVNNHKDYNVKLTLNTDGTYEYTININGKDYDCGLAIDKNGERCPVSNLPEGFVLNEDQQTSIYSHLFTKIVGESSYVPNSDKLTSGNNQGIGQYFGGGVAADIASGGKQSLITVYQRMQNDANTTNTQFGTLCALGGTGQQELTQAVNTAEGDQSSTIQVVSSLASMVSGWAGV